MLGFAINLTVLLVGAYKTMRIYGIAAVISGKRCKHAAFGRARRTYVFLWFGNIGEHTLTLCSATDIIAKLQQERARAAALA